MKSKTLIPLLLIGAGTAAIGYTVFTRNSSSQNTTPYPVTPQNSGGLFQNIALAISNLLTAVSGGITTVNTVLKATGNISGIMPVNVGGVVYTGLLTSNLKRLKAGDRITLTPVLNNSLYFTGTYAVKQIGNTAGTQTDSLIVIEKPYVFGSAFMGTYTEV